MGTSKTAIRYNRYEDLLGGTDRAIAVSYEDISALTFSSNSSIQEVDRIEDNLISQELNELKEDIGEELFNSLSFEDKKFIIETAGELDLGLDVNFERIFDYIENYEDY